MSKPSEFEVAVVNDLRDLKAILVDGDRAAAIDKVDDLIGACEDAWNIEEASDESQPS